MYTLVYALIYAYAMSVENFDHDYIETPSDAISSVESQNDVIVDTKKNLDDLRHDIQHPEVYGKSDEQYYFLGQTKVESGDLRDVTDAIESRDKLSDTKITITWGADQLFMPEIKWQQVLDAEITKLQALKSSFSWANASMIDSLIAELTNPTHHKDLSDKYPRADKRSNLWNARLIAARIASGYTEVLTTIAAKIAETGNETTVSYDIPWESCVIGTSGNKLTDRKINVQITLTSNGVSVDNWSTPTDIIDTPPDAIELPIDEPPTNPTDQPPTDLTNQPPVPTDVEPTPAPVDVVDVLTLSAIQDAITNVLNPAGKLIFWDSKYTYDHTTRSKLPNGDMVVSIKDKSSWKVVLDVWYTADWICYLGLDGYRDIVVTDATQSSLDTFTDFVATHVMAATTPKFETLLDTVAKGRAANVPPVPSQLSSIEVETWSQEVVVRFPNHQWDIVTAAGHPGLFTKDAQGNYFPDIAAIQDYYDKQWLDVDFVVPSQTYENGTTLTDFALDNGKFGGEYQDLETLKKEGKWLLIRYPDGRMEFTHTDEIQTWTSIPAGIDIAMLGSVKRPGKDINENLLWTSSPNRFLVQKQDGSVELLVLYGWKEEQKKFLDNPGYVRALYLDVKGNNGQIDGYWSNGGGKLVYGNHKTGDVLHDGKIPTKVEKGNMPSLLIMTKPRPKKEQPTPVLQEPTVIRPKEEPISIQTKWAGQIDGVVSPSPNLTKIPSAPADLSIGNIDGDEEPTPVIEEKQLLLDPTLSTLYAWLGDVWLKKLHTNLYSLPDTKLLDSLSSEDTFEVVVQLLKIQDVSVKKDTMQLLLSVPLKDALSWITSDQLVNGLLAVSDRNLQSQIIANLLLGNTYPAMLLLGMKEKSEYTNNTIVDKNKLTYNFIKNLERKNRVFDTWLDILGANKLLSNEFGQRWTMPTDVKNAYLMFVSDGIRWQIKNQLPSQNIPSRRIQAQGNYAIISKTDGHMYLFDADHRLVSRKSVLLGSDRSDTPFRVHDYPVKNDSGQVVNFNPPNRTPRGLYSIEARWPKAKIGKYMQFFPKDNQIDYGPLNKNGDRKWTIGIHELYSDAYANRDAAIRSSNVADKFLSNGCINMHNDYYAEVRDHLGIWSSVYVS